MAIACHQIRFGVKTLAIFGEMHQDMAQAGGCPLIFGNLLHLLKDGTDDSGMGGSIKVGPTLLPSAPLHKHFSGYFFFGQNSSHTTLPGIQGSKQLQNWFKSASKAKGTRGHFALVHPT